MSDANETKAPVAYQMLTTKYQTYVCISEYMVGMDGMTTSMWTYQTNANIASLSLSFSLYLSCIFIFMRLCVLCILFGVFHIFLKSSFRFLFCCCFFSPALVFFSSFVWCFFRLLFMSFFPLHSLFRLYSPVCIFMCMSFCQFSLYSFTKKVCKMEIY